MKRKLQANILDEYTSKCSQQLLTNAIQQYIKRIEGIQAHHDKVVFIPEMQGWFNIGKSVNTIYHINKMKDYNHKIISIDAKKHLTKCSILFEKILSETSIEGMYLM